MSSSASIRRMPPRTPPPHSRQLYGFQVVIMDTSSLTVTSSTNVTVDQAESGGGGATNFVIAPRVYPNPWRKDKHTGHPVTFDQMAADSDVKIFTVSGHKVKELSVPTGSVTWDLTNDSGDAVASGIYIYLITDGQGKKSKRKDGDHTLGVRRGRPCAGPPWRRTVNLMFIRGVVVPIGRLLGEHKTGPYHSGAPVGPPGARGRRGLSVRCSGYRQ